MKKCLIICWFGKFPDYYSCWEKSASYNKNYDFLVFTDQECKSEYSNIFFIKKSLDEMNRLIKIKLNIDVEISKPYKFCDFRPAYGILFEDYLKNYRFWGHCDFDQIFGNLDTFVTETILNDYEKINFNGHYTLYKNTEFINNLYKKNDGKFSYRDVFLSKENFAFDEYSGIKQITEKNNIKLIYLNYFCDIDVKNDIYTCVNSTNYKYQIYAWEEGKLFKYYYDGDILKKEEKMYLHFQKKHPQINISSESNRFIICKEGLIDYPSCITKDFILKNNGEYNGIVKMKGYINYFFKKLLEFLKSTNEKKKIWFVQKIR